MNTAISLRPIVVAEQISSCPHCGHRDLHCKKGDRGCSHILVDGAGALVLCGCQG